MKAALLIAAMMLSPMVYGAGHAVTEGDNYIESDDGHCLIRLAGL